MGAVCSDTQVPLSDGLTCGCAQGSIYITKSATCETCPANTYKSAL